MGRETLEQRVEALERILPAANYGPPGISRLHRKEDDGMIWCGKHWLFEHGDKWRCANCHKVFDAITDEQRRDVRVNMAWRALMGERWRSEWDRLRQATRSNSIG